ncbi:uncharacterized protein B0H18DRAFT_877456, partial [Fomitopsis serialis]|uniref:uncharacterized protein n=1 Tax=Fomitopsis serialis TaxID=139415 RepID=UPI002008A209
CKRLKLKCDRRTPCSSCLKRDTVQRCVYSQAAAEKIDVQSCITASLWSRVCCKLSEAPAGISLQAVLGSSGSRPVWKCEHASSYHARSNRGSSMNSSVMPSISNDRALLATGAKGVLS